MFNYLQWLNHDDEEVHANPIAEVCNTALPYLKKKFPELLPPTIDFDCNAFQDTTMKTVDISTSIPMNVTEKNNNNAPTANKLDNDDTMEAVDEDLLEEKQRTIQAPIKRYNGKQETFLLAPIQKIESNTIPQLDLSTLTIDLPLFQAQLHLNDKWQRYWKC